MIQVKEKNLDDIASDFRLRIQALSTLDITKDYFDTSVNQILSDIKTEASRLKFKGKIAEKRLNTPMFPDRKRFQVLRDLDRKLRDIALYRKLLRPVMKKCWIRHRFAKQYRQMMRLPDDEFVNALYRRILLREPDQTGWRNHLSLLNDNEASRKMILSGFVNSKEAYRIAENQPDDFIIYIRKKFTKRSKIRGRFRRATHIFRPGRKYDEVLKRLEILEDKLLQNEHEAQKDKELIDSYYLSYNEKLMPDSREEVKKRAQVYIEKIEVWLGSRNRSEISIVDFGCGECEWIELLQDNGFCPSGVDSNYMVIEKAKQALPSAVIENDDALHFLSRQLDGTLDIITAFHMVEHLDMLSLIKFLLECRRVLKAGGLLILETPNPQNILTATYYFYLDPTHNRPIPPELLEFYVKEAGLKVSERVLLYPLNFCPYDYTTDDPIKHIVFRFNMEQAYGVLAVKEQ